MNAACFEGRALGEPLAPASPRELAGMLRALADAGGAALVRGGGSRLATGNPLARDATPLETRGLSRLLELDADEGVLEAEAGASLAALRKAAAAAGWELPLDPPGAAATLGGALACAAAGPCFPQPRDAVLGLEVALASGALARSGGRVVKNVSGYDLAKLFTGCFGALGVVTSAWLRLRPLPETRRIWAAPPPEPALALEAARRSSVRAALALDAGVAGAPAGGILLLELAGDEPAVASDLAWLAARVPGEEADLAQLERARDALACPDAGSEALALRLAVLPSALAGAARALREAGAMLVTEPARGLLHARLAREEASPGAAARAEAAPGVTAREVEEPPGAAAREAEVPPRAAAREVEEPPSAAAREAEVPPGTAALLATAREAAARGRGSWRVVAAPLALKRGLDVFGDPGPRLVLLRRLKEQYDPACVLNPGRFAGRL